MLQQLTFIMLQTFVKKVIYKGSYRFLGVFLINQKSASSTIANV